MKPSLTFPCLLLLLAPPPAVAAKNPPAAAHTEADSSTASRPTTAGIDVPPEMGKLYRRIGKWQATIRTLPTPGSREGVDNGIMTIEKGPGGFSIVQNFQSRGASGHVVGQSYTWWDKPSASYKSVWCDNMQGCTEFTTMVQGDSWTVELDGAADGRKVHTTIRATMSPDNKCIHEEFTNSYDGGPPVKVTVNEYRRVVAGMPAEKQPSCPEGSDGSLR